MSVLDLAKKRANQREFSSVLKKRKPRLLFLNGHGDNQRVNGDDGNILLKVGVNEKLTKSKIVYALSCRSGKILGAESVKAGASAYLGYDNDFIFLMDEKKSSQPLRDKTANLFLAPSNQVMVSLLKGHSTRDAQGRSRKLFRKNIAKVANSESFSNYLIPYLLWDMNHQVCLGSKKATF